MVKDKDVTVIRNQTLEPGLNFQKSCRQNFRQQEKALRIGILRAPPARVFEHCDDLLFLALATTANRINAALEAAEKKK